MVFELAALKLIPTFVMSPSAEKRNEVGRLLPSPFLLLDTKFTFPTVVVRSREVKLFSIFAVLLLTLFESSASLFLFLINSPPRDSTTPATTKAVSSLDGSVLSVAAPAPTLKKDWVLIFGLPATVAVPSSSAR